MTRSRDDLKSEQVVGGPRPDPHRPFPDDAYHGGADLPPERVPVDRPGAELDGVEGMPQIDPPEGSPGQGLAEYALILALIAVIAIAALVFLGPQISTILSTIGQGI